MNELAEPLIDMGEGGGKKPSSSIEECELHFVRCIKPNEEKVANKFTDSMSLQQITYMGVLESIEVK